MAKPIKGINQGSKPLSPYSDPVRLANVSFGRVDQGVDYWGTGTITALGPGTITNLYNSGWPGGAFIVERLESGPQAGNYWYYAEDITPFASTHIGEKVTGGTPIGVLHGGMETGYAAPPPLTGESLAHEHLHFTFPTPEGLMAERLLKSTGAPGPGSGAGPTGPGNKPIPAQTTGFFSSLFGGLLGNILPKDALERLGLIVFGGLLILVGVFMLVNQRAIKVTSAVVAPEATAASTAKSVAKKKAAESATDTEG